VCFVGKSCLPAGGGRSSATPSVEEAARMQASLPRRSLGEGGGSRERAPPTQKRFRVTEKIPRQLPDGEFCSPQINTDRHRCNANRHSLREESRFTRESRELTRMIFFLRNFFRVYWRDSRVTSFPCFMRKFPRRLPDEEFCSPQVDTDRHRCNADFLFAARRAIPGERTRLRSPRLRHGRQDKTVCFPRRNTLRVGGDGVTTNQRESIRIISVY